MVDINGTHHIGLRGDADSYRKELSGNALMKHSRLCMFLKKSFFNNNPVGRQVIHEYRVEGDSKDKHPYYVDLLRLREKVIVQHTLFTKIKVRSATNHDKLFQEYVNGCGKKLRDIKLHKKAFLVVIGNLQMLEGDCWMAYSRKGSQDVKPPKGVTSDRMLPIIDFLIVNGYALEIPCIAKKDLCDYVYYKPLLAATGKFTQLFGEYTLPDISNEPVLYVRHEKGALPEYQQYKGFWEATAVRGYNQHLSEHKFTLEGVPFKNFFKRIFNSNELDLGGRYYADITNIRNGGPNEMYTFGESYRRFKIEIDGEKTVEVDFKALHPTILYSRVGVQVTGDVYHLDSFDAERSLVKIAMNVMLNCESKEQAISALYFKYAESGIRMEDLVDAIEKKHSKIIQFFYTNCGTYLQYIESCIATLAIQLCVGSEVPMLCIHDSFICKRSQLEQMKSILLEAYTMYMPHMDFVLVDWEWLEGDELKNSGAKALCFEVTPEMKHLDYELVNRIRD